jgi:hypothetical protein
LLAYRSADVFAALAAAVLLLSACQGDRTPPLAGSVGVTVTSGAIALDRERVPVLDEACAEGELVYRAAQGTWACAPAAALLPTGDDAPATARELAALRTRVDMLGNQLAGLDRCSPLPVGQRPPDFAISPASCLVVEAGAQSGTYVLDRGWVMTRGTTKVDVYCPLVPRCDGSDHVWDRAQFFVRDGDGASLSARVRVAIHASFTTRVPPCSGPAPCDAVSELVGGSTLTLELGGYQPPVGRVVPDTYLHAELFTTGTPVGFGGAIID